MGNSVKLIILLGSIYSKIKLNSIENFKLFYFSDKELSVLEHTTPVNLFHTYFNNVHKSISGKR